jgi:hypothetical protein
METNFTDMFFRGRSSMAFTCKLQVAVVTASIRAQQQQYHDKRNEAYGRNKVQFLRILWEDCSVFNLLNRMVYRTTWS